MGWALTYLYQAGLLERVKRGYYKITKLGLKELSENKEHYIDAKYIVAKYASDNKFFSQRDKSNKQNEAVATHPLQEQTPYETAVNAIWR